MGAKLLSAFFMAVAFWGLVEIVSVLFGLRKMEVGTMEWWITCGIIGISSVELVEYLIERKNRKKDKD